MNGDQLPHLFSSDAQLAPPTNLLFSKIESTLLVNSTASFVAILFVADLANRDENVVRQRFLFRRIEFIFVAWSSEQIRGLFEQFLALYNSLTKRTLLDIKHRQRNIFLFVHVGWMDR